MELRGGEGVCRIVKSDNVILYSCELIPGRDKLKHHIAKQVEYIGCKKQWTNKQNFRKCKDSLPPMPPRPSYFPSHKREGPTYVICNSYASNPKAAFSLSGRVSLSPSHFLHYSIALARGWSLCIVTWHALLYIMSCGAAAFSSV